MTNPWTEFLKFFNKTFPNSRFTIGEQPDMKSVSEEQSEAERLEEWYQQLWDDRDNKHAAMNAIMAQHISDSASQEISDSASKAIYEEFQEEIRKIMKKGE